MREVSGIRMWSRLMLVLGDLMVDNNGNEGVGSFHAVEFVTFDG